MKRKDFLLGISAVLGLSSFLKKNTIARPELLYFEDDGIVPNNPLPLLYYQGVFKPRDLEGATWLESTFLSHNWSNSWRNGIFDFQHYHSIAHEALGIYSGSANVLLGGDQGKEVKVAAGDIIVIPAGVGHKNLGSENLGVVGAYPNGMGVDIIRADKSERPRVDENIKNVPKPDQDPFQGTSAGLGSIW